MRSDTPESTASEQRSSTVCFLCRQRKTKCDRNLPRCGFCIKAKVDCQYVSKPKKRGLRAGYVSQLESRIESLENEISSLRNLQTQQTPAIEASPARLERLEQEILNLKNNTVIQSPQVQTSLLSGLSPPMLAAAPFNEPNTPHSALTPSISNGTPAMTSPEISCWSRLGTQSDPNDAVSDLITLPREYLFSLADQYFKETQSWFPIVNQHHMQKALQELPTPVTHIDDIVLRAMIALQLSYSSQAICLGYHGRYRLSRHLRSQVLNEGLSKATLSSVQALLIIAILDYGADNIPSTFSLMSVCRRMCENIGLFRRLLSQMQHQSPTQIGPPAFGSNKTGDELAIPVAWATLALDATTTLGVSWRDVSAALVDHLSSVAYVSAPDLKDTYRTHAHLAAIALQPLHTFIDEHERFRYENSNVEALATCDEIYHNLLGYVQAQPKSSYTLLSDGLIDFDPNLMHTTVLSHASIIVLYQRLLRFDNGTVSTDFGEIPLQRCLQASEDLVLAFRGISDADAELNTPLLAHLIFVAARMKLIVYHNLKQAREPMFDTLMHALNMCGRRWRLARRLDVVLRAAIVQLDTKTIDDAGDSNMDAGPSTSLPSTFWDPRKSHLDLSEELKEWCSTYRDSLFIGALNGPYCKWG